MAVTLTDIKRLLDGLGQRYFCSDELDTVMFLPCRLDGRTVHVVLTLQHEGSFLQLLSNDFEPAPKNGPNSAAVFEEILALNFENKFMKLGRDPNGDNDVVGFGDFWVEDGEITEQQLGRILGNFAKGMCEAQQRLQLAAITGTTARDRQFDDLFDACVRDADTTPDSDDRCSDPSSSRAA